jgi:hypothetical protein
MCETFPPYLLAVSILIPKFQKYIPQDDSSL